MSVEEAIDFFSNMHKIKHKLQTLKDVGLGYIKLGQSATSLSGGEAQRVKLASELQRKATGKTLFILDEPTTGLHTHDVKKLLEVLQRIVENGDTVIVIEHNLDVIKSADYIIDTSNLLTRELKQEIDRIFVDNQDFCNMMISVLSFGFKYGIPADADLVFDVRFLPNPYYVDELRPLTGLDDRVFNYVMDCDIARAFADKLEDMINFLIPNYVKEGKTNLVIAIGCTGGKHRSVTLARELYSRLSGNTKYGFRLEHRDAQKDRLVRKQEG